MMRRGAAGAASPNAKAGKEFATNTPAAHPRNDRRDRSAEKGIVLLHEAYEVTETVTYEREILQ
jgi:hypothetical protein